MAYNEYLDCKCITVGKLIDILNEFPKKEFIMINTVNNLLVFNDLKDDIKEKGYIDILEEKFEKFD